MSEVWVSLQPVGTKPRVEEAGSPPANVLLTPGKPGPETHLLFRRKELCGKGFQAVTVKIPLLTEQANTHPKSIIFQV